MIPIESFAVSCRSSTSKQVFISFVGKPIASKRTVWRLDFPDVIFSDCSNYGAWAENHEGVDKKWVSETPLITRQSPVACTYWESWDDLWVHQHNQINVFSQVGDKDQDIPDREVSRHLQGCQWYWIAQQRDWILSDLCPDVNNHSKSVASVHKWV